jgi:hypothetical protein
MRLALHDLCSIYSTLGVRPDVAGLALQRAGHVSPVNADIDHDGLVSMSEIEWLLQDASVLSFLDSKRVTEDGAEAVAISYVRAKGGWIAKRKLQQGESADWLLQSKLGWLALEISGTASGDSFGRLREKKEQVARCTLPVEKLAVVVAFDGPSILAGRP